MPDTYRAAPPDLESDPEFATSDGVRAFRRDWFRREVRVGDDVLDPTVRHQAVYRVVEVTEKIVKAVKVRG